jgi:hypothetical protein
MFDTVVLPILGLLVLLAGVYAGYRRWIAPHTLDIQGRGLMLLLVLTLMGGFIGSFAWWLDDARSFSWDVPALASRMLASAGWSFALMCLLALNRPTYRRVRLVLLLLCVYLLPLVVAGLVFHLDRFNFALPLTYGFFGIAGGMSVATLWYLARQPHILADDAPTPPSTMVRNWLGLVAVVTGIWGLALFITDSGPLDLIWVWPGDLLSSRLIGVMLLAIAAGCAYSLRYADVSRLMLAMTAAYGLGLAVASLWGVLTNTPIRVSYLVVFGVIFAVSSVLLMRQSSPPTS